MHGSGRLRLDIPPEVRDVIRHLPPEVKAGVTAALKTLPTEPEEGEPLRGVLEGYWKYRVRRFESSTPSIGAAG